MSTESRYRYEFGPFRLELARQLLLHDGQAVQLKPKVFDLLVFLVENHDRLLSKRELMERLWPDQFVEESNLTQSVYELRRALDAEPGGAGYVENVPRRGYRFVEPVRAIREGDGEGEIELPIRSLAVLPFRPLVESDRNEALELGIADSLIAALGRIGSFTVRPTSSIRRYEDPHQESLAAGRELLVDAVLEGTIQRDGDRVRVTARLLRLSDESTLWAETFDEPFSGIFEVEDAIRDRVVGALELELPAADDNRDPAPRTQDQDMQVHQLFLKCRHHWHKWTPEGWRRSIDYGRQVLARDPDHAPTYAWMGASYCCLGIMGELPPHDAFGEGSELVARALELDDTLSDAHASRGGIELFYRWRWEQADRALVRALELNPSNAGARALHAQLHVVTGRPEEAICEARRARNTDPLSPLVNTAVGLIYHYAGRLEAAEEQLHRTLELDTWFAHARLGLAYVHLARGRPEDAVAEMENAAEYARHEPERSASLGYALAIAGDRSAAEAIRDALVERSKQTFVDPYAVALVHLGLDDRDATFKWLDAACEARSRELIYLGVNPIVDPLRSDHRFESLLKRIGLPAG